jgi:hypothetical protein
MMMVLLFVVAWWHDGLGHKFCSDSDDHTAACLALLTCFRKETADAEGDGEDHEERPRLARDAPAHSPGAAALQLRAH